MLENKNVCIISCFDSLEHRVDLLRNYFKSAGANVRVITSDFKHLEKCKRTDAKEDFEFIETIPYKKNLSAGRLKSHYILSKKIFSMIEEEYFDFLWVLVPPNSFVKDAAKYKATHNDTKLVFDLIDLWPESVPISKLKQLPPFIVWKNLRDKNLYSADRIVTECNLYNKRIPKTINSSKVHTIYLAREIKEYKPNLNLPENKISLCYLGSINNIIDISGIANLLCNLSEIRPVELHIIGDGEKRDELISSCKKTGAEVVYHGKLYDMNEKQHIFDLCHYGLNFMKSSVFVGLTMKSMDYFEAGLPIINNIHGDTWDIIEENNLGFNYPKSDITLSDFEDVSMRNRVRAFFEKQLGVDAFEKKLDALIGEMNNE